MRHLLITLVLALTVTLVQAQDTKRTQTVTPDYESITDEADAVNYALAELMAELTEDKLKDHNVDMQWHGYLYIKVEHVADDKYRLHLNESTQVWTLQQIRDILSQGLQWEMPKIE